MDSPGRPPGIIRRPTTGTLQSASGVSRRSAVSGTPTTSRTLVGQSVHWPTPSNEAQYVDEGGRVIRSAPTSNRASETSLRPEQMSRRSTRESIASTLSRGREQLQRRGTDELVRARGNVYLRPAGLRNPNVHLLFVIFRVALAIIADMVVQHGSIPIAMPQQIAIEVPVSFNRCVVKCCFVVLCIVYWLGEHERQCFFPEETLQTVGASCPALQRNSILSNSQPKMHPIVGAVTSNAQ